MAYFPWCNFNIQLSSKFLEMEHNKIRVSFCQTNFQRCVAKARVIGVPHMEAWYIGEGDSKGLVRRRGFLQANTKAAWYEKQKRNMQY
jgi:hypothetical protein